MTFSFGPCAWPDFPSNDLTVYQTPLQEHDGEVWQWWDGSPVDWAALATIPIPDDLGFQPNMGVPYSLAAIKLENAVENMTGHLGDPLTGRFVGVSPIDILPFKPGELDNTRYNVQRPDGTTWS